MRTYRKLTAWMLAAVLALSVLVPSVGAVGSTTMQLTFNIDKNTVQVNSDAKELEVPPVLVDAQPYLPLKAVGELLGTKVEWNDKSKQVELTAPKVMVYFDIDNKEVTINKVKVPLEQIAVMANGKLYVKAAWYFGLIGAKWEYDAKTDHKISVFYTKLPDELIADESGNSRPVAKFTFAKSSYRIGEPVKYIDLSYDPDAEGIAKYEWKGKQDAYFTAGRQTITLTVTDGNGHKSKPYTRVITIENKTYANQLQYKLHHTPVGTAFKTDWSEIWANFHELPSLEKKVVEDRSRKLLLSDSPETIKETGILYQDKVNGKARLYADHINETGDNVQFIIMARNTSKTKPVTIKTTNKGEVYPSIYANIIGHEASVDFMLKDPVQNEKLEIGPDQGFAYVRMPDFYPGQGVNLFYDVETDGEVEFTFMAINNSISTPLAWLTPYLKVLPYNGNVRGTFPMSDMTWNVNMEGVTKPSRLVIGDGKQDPFIKGYDNGPGRTGEVLNEGNYGIMYNIHIEKPKKMAVLLMARGGVFKGPFKINGEFSMAPHSGIIPAFEVIHVLARTNGTEEKLDIEFTPPAGSAFPIDLIFYPLEDLK